MKILSIAIPDITDYSSLSAAISYHQDIPPSLHCVLGFLTMLNNSCIIAIMLCLEITAESGGLGQTLNIRANSATMGLQFGCMEQ